MKKKVRVLLTNVGLIAVLSGIIVSLTWSKDGILLVVCGGLLLLLAASEGDDNDHHKPTPTDFLLI